METKFELKQLMRLRKGSIRTYGSYCHLFSSVRLQNLALRREFRFSPLPLRLRLRLRAFPDVRQTLWFSFHGQKLRSDVHADMRGMRKRRVPASVRVKICAGCCDITSIVRRTMLLHGTFREAAREFYALSI